MICISIVDSGGRKKKKKIHCSQRDRKLVLELLPLLAREQSV